MNCPKCGGDGVIVHEDFEPYGDHYILRREEEYCDCEAGAARERFDLNPVEEEMKNEFEEVN